MKRLLTWLYIKYVFLPGMEKVRAEEDSEAYFLVERCDPNWKKIAAAEYEKTFSTIH